jgi:hypothetical protein
MGREQQVWRIWGMSTETTAGRKANQGQKYQNMSCIRPHDFDHYRSRKRQAEDFIFLRARQVGGTFTCHEGPSSPEMALGGPIQGDAEPGWHAMLPKSEAQSATVTREAPRNVCLG